MLLLWALGLTARLVYLQVVAHEEYQRLADRQHNREVEIQAPRGDLLDRVNQPLALSVPVPSVCMNPRVVRNPKMASELLSAVLKINAKELQAKIRSAQDKNRGFLWVKRKVTPEEADRLQKLGLEWIEFRQESRRVYPNGTLAANLIGSVDHREIGNGGVEQALDKELRGRSGLVRVVTDSRQRGVDSRSLVEAQPGKTVALTIDSRMQFAADTALQKAVQDNDCFSGSAVVLDPYTGEILAMSSFPTFDPNEPVTGGDDIAVRLNQAVTAPFEPGSVFKVFTVAAALETTNLRPETVINCGRGVINLSGQVIHDHHVYDSLPMQDVLAHSSNIGAVNIGLRVGASRLAEYLLRFGFGTLTGVPLPGESAGMVRKSWNRGSVGYVSMGHEIGTTTVQLARAAAAIANGGYLVKPQLVLWKQRPGAPVEKTEKPQPVRILQPETATQMRAMMERVVLAGTGKRAKLAGYTSGGKTGSAQIFDRKTKRYTHVYNASFMGFTPVNNPSLVVVVTLNGAKEFGGVLAAPVFKEIATAALRIRQVTRDLPDEEPAVPAPDNDKMLADAAVPPLAGVALPEPAMEAQAAEELTLANGLIIGPRVPNFRGKTMQDALRESVEAGVPVDVEGRGMVRAQHPAPGQTLAAGQRVRLTFAR